MTRLCGLLCLVILRCAGLLAPRSRRADWLAEWRGELWYVLRRSDCQQALSFCLGSFRDAVWLRRNDCAPNHPPHPMQSPWWCLFLLTAAAAVAATFYFRPAGPFEDLIYDSERRPALIFAHSLMIVIALLVLPATTPLSLGEYPATPRSPARARRLRRWIFLGAKIVLILPIVSCGSFDLAPLVSADGIQAHAVLIGYVAALRWALIDQRRRCPVCLRLLTHPTSIGQPAHTFLELYGTELVCAKGHGLLHVPEIPTTYDTQRWLDLDPSWSSLFS